MTTARGSKNAVAGPGPLLLFDGECGLCNAVVRFLMRADKAAVLRYAPLQGETGQATLRRLGLPTEDFESVVFLPDAGGADFRLKTDGVCAVFAALGGVWRAVAWFRVVPRSWRDALYTLVARLRYRLFGEYKPRPYAKPEWARRVLP